MSRILFVDDEPRVLEGLRRTLRPLRQEWDMEFVPGAQEAMARMDALPFDVLVSDMRMPGADGSDLLEQVMERFPATVRIILSGQCHRHVVLKAAAFAHQFLTKPCHAEALKATILQACRLRDRLEHPRHRDLVCRTTSLPIAPEALSALQEELERAGPSLERLAEIVFSDVALAAKLVQLVSSAFFGCAQTGFDPTRWTAILGIETLRWLAVSGRAVRPAQPGLAAGGFLEAHNGHSRSVARFAGAIAAAETNDEVLIGHAYLGGLLHDAGLLILAEQHPERYATIWTMPDAGRTAVWNAEAEACGTTHADVGACLMALWGAPDAVVEAILFHHCPRLSPATGFTPLAAVHVARAVAASADSRNLAETGLVDLGYLTRIGCAGRLGPWQDLCRAAPLHGDAP